jgi:molybdopterin converting factor small subunit
MFARARELAGTNRDTFQAITVGDVIEQAVARYGAEFAALLPR